MKKYTICFILFISFVYSSWESYNWAFPYKGWGYYRTITLKSNSTSTNLINFPFLLVLSNEDILSKCKINGEDIFFTKEDGSTKLAHEIISVTANTLKIWIKLPVYLANTNNIVLIYYGNDNCSPQENIEGVWSEGYSAVWHLDETPPIGGIMFDATANNNDGIWSRNSSGGNGTSDTNGIIDGCNYFDGTNVGNVVSGDATKRVHDLNYIQIPTNPTLRFSGKVTKSAWINLSDISAGSQWGIISSDIYLDSFYVSGWYNNSISAYYRTTSSEPERLEDANLNLPQTTNTLVNNWHYVTLVIDQDNSWQNLIYLDGQMFPVGTDISNYTPDTNVSGAWDESYHSTSDFFIGTMGGGRVTDFLYGFIDEVRVSSVVRSSDWIKASYTNQITPESFIFSVSEAINIPKYPMVAEIDEVNVAVNKREQSKLYINIDGDFSNFSNLTNEYFTFNAIEFSSNRYFYCEPLSYYSKFNSSSITGDLNKIYNTNTQQNLFSFDNPLTIKKGVNRSLEILLNVYGIYPTTDGSFGAGSEMEFYLVNTNTKFNVLVTRGDAINTLTNNSLNIIVDGYDDSGDIFDFISTGNLFSRNENIKILYKIVNLDGNVDMNLNIFDIKGKLIDQFTQNISISGIQSFDWSPKLQDQRSIGLYILDLQIKNENYNLSKKKIIVLY